MKASADPGLVKRLSIFASAASLFSTAIGLSVLAGWTFGVADLITWGLGTPMAPNAAAGTVLAGVSLWLMRKHDQPPTRAGRVVAQSAAAVVAMVGLLTLAEHLFSLNFGIDHALLRTPLPPQLGQTRVLMSPIAAGHFLLFGVALLLVDWRTRRDDWPAQFVCLGAALAPAFGLLGLILGPKVTDLTLALPAVFSIFLLASGLICSRPTWALGGLLASRSAGARLLRRAVPSAVLVLSLVGWFISKPLLTDSHFTWVEVSVLAVICSGALAGFVAWIAFIVERSDAERQRAETALNIGKEQLDRLMDRTEHPESERRLLRKVHAAFAVALLLTGLLGLLSWHSAQRAAEEADWVTHTHEVSAMLELTLGHLLDVETGGRGFAVTGDERFLEPYKTGRVAVGEDLHRLRRLIVDEDQGRRLEVLAEEAKTQTDLVDELVAARRITQRAPALAVLEQGKRIMDSARITVAEMEARQKSLLLQRSQRARAAQRVSISIIALGSAVGVVFLSIAGVTVSREIGISAGARARVDALNSDLERRVAERTAALGESEGRLAGMIQSAMDAILTADEQQNIVLFNGAAERMFRCPASEALGRHIAYFIPQRYHAAHEGQVKKFGESGATARAMGALGKLWAVRADGEEFRIEASISHVEAAGKKLFTVILRDITERVRAEAVREHLAAVVDSSDDAIISKDLNGVINGWNRGAEKIFGYTVAEALGKPMLMLFPPELVKEETDILARIGRGESVEHYETVRVRKDGGIIDVSVTISPIRDSGGTVVGASKIARDITERKRAEEALRQSEERFHTLIEQASDAFFLHDGDGRFLEVNREACESLGYTREELLRMGVFDIEQEVDVGKARQAWEEAEPGKAYTIQGTQRRKDGTAFPIEVRLSAYYVGGKKLHLGLVRDTTERRRAEEALREKEHLLSESQRIAHLGSWTYDPNDASGRIVWSEELYRIYGVSPETFVPTVDSLTELVVPEDRAVMQTWIAACAAGEQPDEFEFRITWPDGSVRTIAGRGELQRDASNRPAKMAGSAQDITERKRTEAALRESQTNFAAVVNLAPQFVWICTNEGLNTYFNDRWFQYTGLTAEQSHGTGWNTPFHPDDKQTAWDHWNQATATGKTYMVESRLRAANGSYRWFLVRGEPVRDANGGIVKWFGTCTDIDEMKRAQAELRESEERFQAMANGIPQLACMAGADGHIFWYNQRWYDYTGTTPEQMEGWGWQSVLDAAVLPSVLERWASAIASAEPFEMEFQLRRADGVFGTFLNRVMPLKDAAGDVTRWFGTNTDISERKQMELRLKAQAQELSASSQSLEAQTRVFKLVLDSMGEGLIAADGEGRFIIWNEAARQQMGRDAADLPGEQWRDFYKVFLPDGVTPYPPESLPLLRALRGESVRVELMVEQPDHAEGVFLEVTARPMKDAEGDLCGGVAVLRDITERKHSDARLARLAEELSGRASELAASRQALETESLMLQSVLNSMSEGLVAADETGKFILWNPAAARIVGLGGTNVPPGEWGSYYGTYLPDTITPFPMDQNPLVRAIRGEVCSAEIFIRNPELEHGVWIESNGAPLRAKNGVLRGGVVAFRDITQRRADELEIRKLNEELEERVLLRTAELATANQELEAFAYSVSHDLRAPLRHIGGFSKILIEDFGPTLAPEAVRHLERIEEGTRRMGMLVDELLNLAQVGRHALKLQSTPLNSLIEEVISLLQPEVQGRVVTWKVAELPAAECDPVLTKQIFQNLIANALKFTRPRERAVIEIGIVPEGGQMAVFVRDNGVGFDMKYSDKLFGVFQRLHRIEDFEGTGVGLATVQRIVHKHGGRVWAEAELDKGAAFFFTLEPVKGSHLKAEEVLRSEAKALNTKETGSKAAAAAGDGK